MSYGLKNLLSPIKPIFFSDSDCHHLAVTIVERIARRLWRADCSRSYYERGSGLGLAITKAIVNNHQGTIDVISQLNLGSHFAVRLPVELSKLVVARLV